ncbi:hypothetical protein [Flavobacterium sp.]|uniref:hypothetical protein n=1 Tax=Flavobacterium sp. TaxID=239 RepID=UPI003D127F81
MKKIILGFVLVSVLFSCNGSKEKRTEKNSGVTNTAPVKDSLHDNEIGSSKAFENDLDILLPRSYRTYDGKNPAASLNEKWIDLYEKSGEYYLGKADFEIEKGFDECSGDSLNLIIPKNKTILFIDYPQLKLGKIKSLKIDENKIWPKEKITFTFNNVSYTLRGEGKVISSEKRQADDGKEEVFNNVQHYKLYLSAGDDAEKLLLAEDSFQDTFVELRFAGDIDGDGKLDLIFSANRNYEEERVILFLSSKAENDGVIKKVAEIAVQFDC